MTLVVHIVAGVLGLVLGAVALSAAKGERLHRKSGMLFVYAMLTMSLTGAAMAAIRRDASVIGGLLAAYLTITALATVRSPAAASRRLDLAAMLVAFAVGLTGGTLGIGSLVWGDGTLDGIPAPMLLIFASVALLAGVSDVRILRSGPLRGAPRLARHLWRMCFALFIATGSFFLGQADEFPEQLRIYPLLAVLALAPLLVMPYWLWRVRIRPGHSPRRRDELAAESRRALGEGT